MAETYFGVGQVITLWGYIETELMALYSHFVGRYEQLDAFTDYGEGTVFRQRFAAITSAAKAYFVGCPHQEHEAAFDRLSTFVLGFADRRNEIAHGVVMRVELAFWLKNRLDPEVRERANYMVLPPFYWKAKHQADGTPGYAYTSVELTALGQKLFTLSKHIRAYLMIMLPPELRDELPPEPPEPLREK